MRFKIITFDLSKYFIASDYLINTYW